MKIIFKPYILIAFIVLVACGKKDNNANQEIPENNGIDISFTQTDTSLNLNLFYVSLNDIGVEKILVNGIQTSYAKLNNETVKLDKSTIKLGRNQVIFIFKKNNKLDTIQKDLYNTIQIGYSVKNTIKHNNQYFTQGLLFDEAGNLIESMGMEGKSRIVFYNKIQNAFKVKDSIINKDEEFGEGVTILGNKIIQLLWKNNYIKIFDKTTKQLIKQLEYKSEGWGLCTNGDKLYASNGSNNIHVIDINGNTVKVVQTISVNDQQGPVANINELEFINGVIYANIWQSNTICLIDPNTGDVIGKIDLTKLAEQEGQMSMGADVLNGIAYNDKKHTLLITGKYWNYFYEIKLDKDLSLNAM